MTDPRNESSGSYWTSGRGAEAGDEPRTAADSGEASVRPNRPGAASPAGWFPPPAGEAAPPVRLREPARSDGASPYSMETRPTSLYRIPWQPARADRGRQPQRRPQYPMARPHRNTPDGSGSRGTSPDLRTGAPDMRWPSLTRRGPRHIPVVGPTEALPGPAAAPRGRAGDPGTDVPPVRSLACSTTRGSPAGSSPSAHGRTRASPGRTPRRRSRTTRRPTPTRPTPTRPTPTRPTRTQPTRTPRSRPTRTRPTLTRTTPTTPTTSIRTMTRARRASTRRQAITTTAV